jgi:hypothetical protein
MVSGPRQGKADPDGFTITMRFESQICTMKRFAASLNLAALSGSGAVGAGARSAPGKSIPAD